MVTRFLLGVSALFLSNISFAQQAMKDLRQLTDPMDICRELPAPADRQKCGRILAEHDHFDADAARVCTTFMFSQDKLACLRNIAGKIYEDRVLEVCARESMTSSRLQCLSQNGRAFDDRPLDPNCLPLSQLERDLERSLVRIDSGETSKARALIDHLLHQVRVCRF